MAHIVNQIYVMSQIMERQTVILWAKQFIIKHYFSFFTLFTTLIDNSGVERGKKSELLT